MSDHPTLDFAPAHPKVRNTDPPTSAAAWDRVQANRGSQHALIYCVVVLHGPMTCDDVCTHTEIRWNSASTRISELIKEGLLYDTGVVRDGQRLIAAHKKPQRSNCYEADS